MIRRKILSFSYNIPHNSIINMNHIGVLIFSIYYISAAKILVYIRLEIHSLVVIKIPVEKF